MEMIVKNFTGGFIVGKEVLSYFGFAREDDVIETASLGVGAVMPNELSQTLWSELETPRSNY